MFYKNNNLIDVFNNSNSNSELMKNTKNENTKLIDSNAINKALKENKTENENTIQNQKDQLKEDKENENQKTENTLENNNSSLEKEENNDTDLEDEEKTNKDNLKESENQKTENALENNNSSLEKEENSDTDLEDEEKINKDNLKENENQKKENTISLTKEIAIKENAIKKKPPKDVIKDVQNIIKKEAENKKAKLLFNKINSAKIVSKDINEKENTIELDISKNLNLISKRRSTADIIKDIENINEQNEVSEKTSEIRERIKKIKKKKEIEEKELALSKEDTIDISLLKLNEKFMSIDRSDIVVNFNPEEFLEEEKDDHTVLKEKLKESSLSNDFELIPEEKAKEIEEGVSDFFAIGNDDLKIDETKGIKTVELIPKDVIEQTRILEKSSLEEINNISTPKEEENNNNNTNTNEEVEKTTVLNLTSESNEKDMLKNNKKDAKKEEPVLENKLTKEEEEISKIDINLEDLPSYKHKSYKDVIADIEEIEKTTVYNKEEIHEEIRKEIQKEISKHSLDKNEDKKHLNKKDKSNLESKNTTSENRSNPYEITKEEEDEIKRIISENNSFIFDQYKTKEENFDDFLKKEDEKKLNSEVENSIPKENSATNHSNSEEINTLEKTKIEKQENLENDSKENIETNQIFETFSNNKSNSNTNEEINDLFDLTDETKVFKPIENEIKEDSPKNEISNEEATYEKEENENILEDEDPIKIISDNFKKQESKKTFSDHNEDKDYISKEDLKNMIKVTDIFGGFFKRSFAFIIDFLVIYFIVDNLSSLFGIKLSKQYENLCFPLIFAIYNFTMVLITKGKTLGKLVFNLKVVSNINEELTFTDVLIREFFGKIILMKFQFLFLLIVFSKRKHHLIDYLADTSVINDDYEKAFKKLMDL